MGVAHHHFKTAMLAASLVLAVLQSAGSTGTCETPHLSLIGDKFITITEREELTLSCSMQSSPSHHVDVLWYFQFKNLTSPIDTATVPYHHPDIKFEDHQDGDQFSVTVRGLSARLEQVMVQCTARASGEPERFSKGAFLVHVLPSELPMESWETLCLNKSSMEELVKESFGNCAKDQVLKFTTQTMVVSSCLIVSTITLFMVVIVLCQLRKRD